MPGNPNWTGMNGVMLDALNNNNPAMHKKHINTSLIPVKRLVTNLLSFTPLSSNRTDNADIKNAMGLTCPLVPPGCNSTCMTYP
mmetsp:Transcript_4432/g.6690  ORF Transcript_4432/g.6690 Transcript_4432/m.6690 type:complete len:84 (-) Transcript_4432:866-1117(-)